MLLEPYGMEPLVIARLPGTMFAANALGEDGRGTLLDAGLLIAATELRSAVLEGTLMGWFPGAAVWDTTAARTLDRGNELRAAVGVAVDDMRATDNGARIDVGGAARDAVE